LPVARQVILVVFGSNPGLQVTLAVELKKLSSAISGNNSPFGNKVRLPQSVNKRLTTMIRKSGTNEHSIQLSNGLGISMSSIQFNIYKNTSHFIMSL